MSSYVVPPALICPYTLMEEEALAWAILFFGQGILLHPYPLPLPVSVQSWTDQGMIQVRFLVQTPEAIREKDRLLRGIKQYVVDNPGMGFLKYLMWAAAQEEMETQEEIAGLMKGRPFEKPQSDSPLVNGPILLCLVHEWMMQEWEVDISLAAAEKQEKNIIQGWQEDPGEESIWSPADPLILKRNDTEINCPPALAAWWELRNKLVPEPVTLFTTQHWVWAEHYGLDPEEGRTNSILLPDLGTMNKRVSQDLDGIGVIREKMEAVLRLPRGSDSKSAVDDFQIALLQLDLPLVGQYRLVFPPNASSLPAPLTPRGQRVSDPLILLLPALI
jgi:hypothetical protein